MMKLVTGEMGFKLISNLMLGEFQNFPAPAKKPLAMLSYSCGYLTNDKID